MIEFRKRPRIELTDAARRRIWLSAGGLYRVVESRCRYGPRKGPQAIPVVFYAQVASRWGWEVISRHRGRGPAEAACQSHYRRHCREVA